MDTFEAIRLRRSISKLTEPAPSDEEIRVILEAAVQAPDHKSLQPWRFVLLQGINKRAFGDVMIEALIKREPGATEGQIEKERSKLERAPLVIIVIAKHVDDRLPFVELIAATSAATQNLLLAATDLGYATIWRTGDVAYDANIKQALGFASEDVILGFIYLGTNANGQPEPRAPRLEGVVSHWQA